MITSAFVSILAWVVQGISFFLPTGNLLPANFSDLISDVIAYAYGWDWLLPVSTIFSIFGVMIIFFVAEFAWRGGKYLIALLRGN